MNDVKSEIMHLLVVEDSKDDAELLLRALKKEGFQVESHRVEDLAGLNAALDHKEWDIVVADYNLPQMTGLQALQIVKQKRSDTPFILFSGSVGEAHAVEVMRAGVQDYVPKDDIPRLIHAVKREWSDFVDRKKIRNALKESEEQLRQSQKLEAVGRLAGGIAHDFNNLLAIATLNCEAAMRYGSKDDATQKYLDQILKTCERASSLVKQLLSFSRKQIVQPKNLDVNAALLDIEKMLCRLLGEDVKFKLDLCPKALSIFVDRTQFEQVIMNLVVNARDAMPTGGHLCIATDIVEAKAAFEWEILNLSPGRYMRLRVTDSGCGMTPEVKAKIFDPFFTTKGIGKGTGLGLSTVYGIVKQYEGAITVDTEKNKGTTFSIFWPESEHSDVQEIVVTSKKKTTAATGTVLVVEDDRDLRDIVCQTLEQQGFQVLQAGNGIQAVDVFKAHKDEIDLLITDVIMPEMAGTDLVKVIQKLSTSVKILMLSGYAEEMLSTYGVQESAFLMEKPFTVRTLIDKVQDILSEKVS